MEDSILNDEPARAQLAVVEAKRRDVRLGDDLRKLAHTPVVYLPNL
jgi:hypothetical protein